MTDRDYEEEIILELFQAFGAKVDGKPITSANMPVIKPLSSEEIIAALDEQLGNAWRDPPQG